MNRQSVVKFERHYIEEERTFPDAPPARGNLLCDVAVAAMPIGREVHRFGLIDIRGKSGEVDVHGPACVPFPASTA